MTLLEEWQQKPSWQATYPILPLYQSFYDGHKDIDLRAMIQHEPTLTFEILNPIGFAEFTLVPAEFPKKELQKTVFVSDTIDMIAWEMISILDKYLRNLWDPREKHIVFCSGGRDSRIIARILKNIHDKVMDLGEFYFLCHEPEHDIFKKAMENMGWDEQYYRVHKEDAVTAPDYYRIPEITHSTNGYIGPDLFFYPEDVIEKDTVLVSGSLGGELVDYPTYRFHKSCLGRLLSYTHYPRMFFSHFYCHWKDILLPYASYEYLNFVFNIPSQYFQITGDRYGTGGDLLRDSMLKCLGDDPPYYYSHSYNLKLSEDTQKRINADFKNSNFYQMYDFYQYVREVKPAADIFNKFRRPAKTYGMATVLEGFELEYLQDKASINKVTFKKKQEVESTLRAQGLAYLKKKREEDAKNG